MRIIGLVAMSVWLGACSATPMFPPAVMKDVEANTFEAKAWEKEAYQPSSVTFVRHKVELAGEIIGVIKRIFGFTKVRYRGLAKNTHRLLVTCALTNLHLVRRDLQMTSG